MTSVAVATTVVDLVILHANVGINQLERHTQRRKRRLTLKGQRISKERKGEEIPKQCC
jgi:hypothetical protein